MLMLEIEDLKSKLGVRVRIGVGMLELRGWE